LREDEGPDLLVTAVGPLASDAWILTKDEQIRSSSFEEPARMSGPLGGRNRSCHVAM